MIRARLSNKKYDTIFSVSEDYNLTLVEGIYNIIYPSRRQNLLLTLEILIQNFPNFQNFGKKFQNFDFFLKISTTTEGPPLRSKGPPPPY